MSEELKKVRVSCVSYLNSKLFLYGLQNHPIQDEIELSLDHPRECAEKLMSGRADIGLVPVASLLRIPGYRIITNKSIGADGAVRSVMLFSRVPLEQIETILLDYQSMTSVNLCKVLCEEHWNINPVFRDALPGYERTINGTTAAVIIGDRALELLDTFEYAYDLAENWKQLTGLPFVFACWVSNTSLPKGFEERFDEALQQGLDAINMLIPKLTDSLGLELSVTNDYFRKHLRFDMSERHRQALQLFLGKIAI
ncbi:MAG: menaquinone biosynthetic enzyme MqnA/MqnD family protein [Bacteroidota bacterium]|jgi:chorismate dehydratase